MAVCVVVCMPVCLYARLFMCLCVWVAVFGSPVGLQFPNDLGVGVNGYTLDTYQWRNNNKEVFALCGEQGLCSETKKGRKERCFEKSTNVL